MLTSNKVVEDYIKRTEKNIERVQSTFSNLSEHQFNWKPANNIWSVGECINHLITTNKLYHTKIENLLTSAAENTETDIPYSQSFLGIMITKGVDPANARKAKTFKVFLPETSNVMKSVIENYASSSRKFIDLASKLQSLNLKKYKLSSPVNVLIRLNLGDPLIIIPRHDERHINQAERLIYLESFPKD